MASNECFFNAKGAGKGNYVKNGLIWAVMGLITREIGHDKVQHWGREISNQGKELVMGKIAHLGKICTVKKMLSRENY